MARTAALNPLVYEIPPPEPDAGRHARRAKGLEARHAAKLARKAPVCRYLGKVGGMCTGEAVDPEAEVRLCQRHLGLVLETVLPKVYAKIRADILAEVEKALRQEQAA